MALSLELTAILKIVGIILIAIAILSLWYKFRKGVWAFLIASFFAIIAGGLLFLFGADITLLLNNAGLLLGNGDFATFIVGCISTFLTVGMKALINYGFKMTIFELGTQN